MRKGQSIKMFIILLICFFAMLVFAGCIESAPLTLEEYKEAAIAEIEAYARAKGTQDEFTEERWEYIQLLISTTSTRIDRSTDKTKVDKEINYVKEALDDCCTIAELAELIEAANSEIDAYVRAKGTQEEFTEDEWVAMQQYVLSAMDILNNKAFGKKNVDMRVGHIKDELDHYYYTIAGLAAFKETAKAELEDLYESYRIEGRFAVEDWDEALQEVTDAKVTIDSAVSGRVAYNTFDNAEFHLRQYTYLYGSAITQNKSQLKSHAYEIKKNIYTVGDWEAITGILEQGKAAINAAAGYGDIETAKTTAIVAMDAVELTVALEEDIYNIIKQDYFEEYGKEFWFSRILRLL